MLYVRWVLSFNFDGKMEKDDKEPLASHYAEGLRRAEGGEADVKRRGLHSQMCARVSDSTINTLPEVRYGALTSETACLVERL